MRNQSLFLDCQSGVWRRAFGNVVPQSQVTAQNNAIRAAALAGCVISVVTQEVTYSACSSLGNRGVRGTYTASVDASGAVVIDKVCQGIGGWAVNAATGNICKASGMYGILDGGWCTWTGGVHQVVASFSDEHLGGGIYRGKLAAGSSVAYCPNSYTLPAWEAAYIAP